MAEDQGDKTEEATDQRRDEFRKRGQVAMTRELGSAVFFLVAAGLIYVSGRFFLQNIIEIFNRTMGGDLIQLFRDGKLTDVFSFVGLKLVILTGPVFVIALVVGVGSQIVQTGLLQIENAVSPDLNKLNPLNGLGRIFSMRGVAELFKSVLKMSAIGIVMYFLLKAEVRQLPYLTGYSISQLMTR